MMNMDIKGKIQAALDQPSEGWIHHDAMAAWDLIGLAMHLQADVVGTSGEYPDIRVCNALQIAIDNWTPCENVWEEAVLALLKAAVSLYRERYSGEKK